MTYQVQTFRGASNGWQARGAQKTDRTGAARLLQLLNRIEPQLLHKAVAV